MTARVRIPIGVDEEARMGYERMVEAIRHNESLVSTMADILVASGSPSSECFLRAADPLIDAIQAARSQGRSFTSGEADLDRFFSLGPHGMRVELRKNIRGGNLAGGLRLLISIAQLVEQLQRSYGLRFRFGKTDGRTISG